MAIENLAVVRHVGRYEIVREIGRGGTAVVYLARQTDLDRYVALKELAAFRASDPAFIERFLRESRVTGSLNHANIVTVHEYFEHDGATFIAMEYFERGSLRGLIRDLELQQVAGVLEGLLAGLAHAGARGIVHRDLKPENVMVTSNGGVKIADFGIAKARELQGGGALTASGTTVGTPAYMAPEQALGNVVGAWTDLYSVGVIAYELLAGRVPFDRSEAPIAIMLRHLNDEPPSLRSLVPELDRGLAAYVERLLSKQPAARPQTAADAWDELEEIVIRIAGPRWRRWSRLTDMDGAQPPLAAPSPASTAATARLTRRLRVGSNRARAAWLVMALGLLGAGGATAAILLADNPASGSGTSERTTTPTLETKKPSDPRSVAGPTVSSFASRKLGRNVTVSLRLTGPPLVAGALVVRDRDLTDGRAMLQLRQRGITARTRGGSEGRFSILIRKGRGFVRVDLGAEAGAFTTLRARRVDGRRVVLELQRAAPPPSVTSSTPSDTRTTTTTTEPTPPPPKKKPPPDIETH